jgi:hypothetical protein
METCSDCSMRPRGPGGHAALVAGGPVDFRQSLFRCSACQQVWRRHYGGADTYYWQVEVPKTEPAAERQGR